MIIKSLEVKNYRPYQEPDTIYFANGDKNITIVEGINDTGKTSLINAINWYPHIFDNEDESAIIIDGIIHHMYPLPVSASKEIDENYLDLKNYDMIENIFVIISSCF